MRIGHTCGVLPDWDTASDIDLKARTMCEMKRYGPILFSNALLPENFEKIDFYRVATSHFLTNAEQEKIKAEKEELEGDDFLKVSKDTQEELKKLKEKLPEERHALVLWGCGKMSLENGSSSFRIHSKKTNSLRQNTIGLPNPWERFMVLWLHQGGNGIHLVMTNPISAPIIGCIHRRFQRWADQVVAMIGRASPTPPELNDSRDRCDSRHAFVRYSKLHDY